MTCPADPELRAKRRKQLRANVMARAELEASRVGRTIRCERNDHRRILDGGVEAGCANTGETCICECHDLQRVPEPADAP